MKYALLIHNNCHSNYTNRIFLQRHMFRSIDLYVLRDACHELFCVFKDFYASGTQDAEVTKSLICMSPLPPPFKFGVFVVFYM